MPLDAFFLSALTQELSCRIIGMRVDKVQQPERDTLILHLRGQGETVRLLLSASVNHPRIHLTEFSMENPAQPPMFCMLLRKHLVGARLAAITQPPAERLCDLRFECVNEFGDSTEKHLVLELMGRNSNLILQGEDGRVLDCLRRVGFDTSEQRQVLPGLFYHLPPTQGKRIPAQTDADTLASMLLAAQDGQRFDEWLLSSFAGLSPLLCRELSYRFFGSADVSLSLLDKNARIACAGKLASIFAEPPETVPILLRQDGVPKDFSCLPIRQYEGFRLAEPAESFSSLLDTFYYERDRAERMQAKTQTIRKTLTTLQSRITRKLENQRLELEKTKDRERLRQLGDILTANLHAVGRGQSILDAVDFYDPEMKTVRIPLDPAVSPQQNAAKFYKDYQKAKTAEKMLTEQIANGERELEYLAATLDCLSRAESERDIAEIRAELTEGKYLRPNGNRKQMKLPPSKPMHFVSSDGFDILVGRNNVQNDLLTLKTASKRDFWLHTQKIHGSHVILFCDGAEPSDEAFTEAAMLAAYYSQAREGQNVPVDCTKAGNVRKPNGAKPGMVIYSGCRTLFVTPDPERIRAMRKEP